MEFYEELRRYNYVTPTSYLELLMCFVKLLSEKREEYEGLKGRLSGGLEKLVTTAAEVAGMQDELVTLQPVLVHTAKEADAMMAAIAIDQADAAVTKDAVLPLCAFACSVPPPFSFLVHFSQPFQFLVIAPLNPLRLYSFLFLVS